MREGHEVGEGADKKFFFFSTVICSWSLCKVALNSETQFWNGMIRKKLSKKKERQIVRPP